MIAVYDILDFLFHPLIAVSLTLPVSPACLLVLQINSFTSVHFKAFLVF